MINLGKKIVSIIIMLFLSVSCVASFFALNTTTDLTKLTTENHPFATLFSNIYGRTKNMFGPNYFEDSESTIYKLKNGHLAYKKDYVNPAWYENSLVSFHNYLQQNNIDFMHVMTSEKGDERLGQLPIGIETNNCGAVFTDYKAMLTKNNIAYMDTFNILVNSGKDFYDYFYKTDHHWNDHAGLLLTKELTNTLNEKFDYSLDSSLFDMDKHSVVHYDKIFYGSMLKKIGEGYMDFDDVDVILPKYDTNFITSLGPSGPYSQSIINNYFLNYNKSYSYYAFLSGEQALINIENKLINNDIKILVLKDSKANVITPHLACAVQYLDIIDLRVYKSNVLNYIEQTSPDAVLMIQSPFAASVHYNVNK